MELQGELARRFAGEDAFDRIMALSGEVFRALEGRRTLRFDLDGRGYFAKLHRGIGWREIFKNLFQLRLPVLGADNEWRAIRRLEALGVETMKVAGYGRRGWNPARRESFVITEELKSTVSLEDFCRDWPADPPPPALKRALIRKVAGIARCLHENGVNHRDFYLCHFLLDLSQGEAGLEPGRIRTFLIDLHRVQIRRRTPQRWIVKDLAGLYFSSMDIGLRARDLFRFMKTYRHKPLREILPRESSFWRGVSKRAVRLYQKDFAKDPRLVVPEHS